jgi:hypothetical protein
MTRPPDSVLRGLALAVLLLLALPAVAQPEEASDALAPDAQAILARAFANRYEVDLASDIELIMRNQSGQERTRKFRAISKVIEGRMHSIGRLVWPHYLRGMTILTVEAVDRTQDTFVYLPSVGKVRRISTAQRGDSFLGSDVTYEDMERRRVSEYRIEEMASGRFEGEDVFEIRAVPVAEMSYDRVTFVVAASDHAILETRYFRDPQAEPLRVVSTPREFMVAQKGHVLPTRLRVRYPSRGTTTEVVLHGLTVDPDLDPQLFSLKTLEQKRRLPGEND